MRPLPISSSIWGALFTLIGQSYGGFKILCDTNVIERIDPIISPGAVSQHVHVVAGANTINYTTAGSSYSTLTNAPCTSCIVKEDKSLYWAPSLYYHAQNGSFIRVPIDGDTSSGARGGINIYYLHYAPSGTNITAFPPGFRMIAGNPFTRSPTYNATYDSYNNFTSFQCLGTNFTSNDFNYNGLPPTNCSGGIRAQIHFPHCWDGVHVDNSTDHHSHMAYPLDGIEGTNCPADHPISVMHLFYEILFNSQSFTTQFPWYNSSQPFVLAQGDPTGYGLHADFVNGWNSTVLANAANTCHATDNVAGDAKDCYGFTIASFDEMLECDVAQQVNENVNGPFALLPGCNPIQSGPATATTVAGCTRTGSIGPAKTYYTDQTKTFGYGYIGCGNDTNGDNQFSIYNIDGTGMTVEKCVGICNQNAYTYAALCQNSGGTCYCGNTGKYANRFPQPGILGNCDQPCPGNSSEYCGGFNALSYYQRCAQNGTGCVNTPSA